jgi:RNA polymerase-binding transcription factor DksA
MPEEEFVELMRERLVQRRVAILARLAEGREEEQREPIAELVGSVPDTGDQSVALERADLRNARMGRDLAELRAVDAALERIAAGDYGICPDCGGEIGEARLRAHPSALRDVRCQGLFEQLYVDRSTAPSL